MSQRKSKEPKDKNRFIEGQITEKHLREAADPDSAEPACTVTVTLTTTDTQVTNCPTCEPLATGTADC